MAGSPSRPGGSLWRVVLHSPWTASEGIGTVDLIGTVVRLQVQVESLKVQGATREQYEPAGLRCVSTLRVDEGGVTGCDESGEALLDCHHRDHLHSKNRDGSNGISIGFTGHYALMRERFGDHLSDGIAGENIVVQVAGRVSPDTAARGFCIVPADGPDIMLEEVFAAEPCVPFTRFALRVAPDARSDRAVKEGLAFLREGTRGYYASYRGRPATVRLGDRLYSL